MALSPSSASDPAAELSALALLARAGPVLAHTPSPGQRTFARF